MSRSRRAPAASIVGHVQGNAADLLWVQGRVPVQATEATCDFSTPFDSTGGPATLTMDGAYAGRSSCNFQPAIKVKPGSTENAVLLRLELPMPTGWTSTLNAPACGTPINNGTPVGLDFTVAMTANAEPGSGTTFSADTAGIVALPQSQFTAGMIPSCGSTAPGTPPRP